MSAKHRGHFAGEPVVRQIPAPAGAVRLETFVPWRLVRRNVRREIIAPPGAAANAESQACRPGPEHPETADTALLRALGLAHHWQRLLSTGRFASVAEIAEAEGLDVSQVHRLMRLTLLAPEVVERLVESPDLPVERLLGRPWPYGWAEQMRVLGTVS